MHLWRSISHHPSALEPMPVTLENSVIPLLPLSRPSRWDSALCAKGSDEGVAVLTSYLPTSFRLTFSFQVVERL